MNEQMTVVGLLLVQVFCGVGLAFVLLQKSNLLNLICQPVLQHTVVICRFIFDC